MFEGRVKDLETWLIEERFPEGWETKARDRFGLSFGKFNITVLGVEFGISEKKYLAKKKVLEEAVAKTKQIGGADSDSSETV